MDSGEMMYAFWTPITSPWSAWVKPVLFAQFDARRLVPSVPLLHAESPTETPPSWVPRAGPYAIIVNLPGIESLKVGLTLARNGYRPIPLFNGCPGGPRPAVQADPLLALLPAATHILRNIALPEDAPPAFLLDYHRCPRLAPGPGEFDNRWLVFPQDFPSGRTLIQQKIDRVLLVQGSGLHVQDDLSHVLLRWQQAGLTLAHVNAAASTREPLEVKRPRWFGSLMYRTLVLLGLRRNSLGGFGALVPVPQSGGG